MFFIGGKHDVAAFGSRPYKTCIKQNTFYARIGKHVSVTLWVSNIVIQQTLVSEPSV